MATPFETTGEIAGEPADEPSVIDLTTVAEAHTNVRILRDDNPLASMSEADRMRLFIRVLCELVAYGELDPVDASAAPAAATV